MRAEVIAVGTELLLGEIPNTNSQFISERLATVGVDVLFHTSVGDNEARLAGSISLALDRSDAVILTGGLGPTHDDVTREAIAAATGRALNHVDELEKELREWFEERGREMALLNKRQCLLPEGAVPIPNPLGTAPGVHLEHEGKLLFALPGVPDEMKAMLDYVLPRLSERSGGEVLVSRTLKATGIPEADLAAKIESTVRALDSAGSATIALLGSVGEVKIRISAKAPSHHGAFIKIFQVDSRLKNILGDLIFGADEDSLESVVGDLAKARNLVVAVAESFTGGALISRLIQVPDASEFVSGGYVTYSVESKMKELGVSARILEDHGAVSAETALAMAKGVRERAGADIGLSTTGEAGPEPQEQPVGTMFLGLAWDGGSIAQEHFVPGERDSVTRFGTQAALNLFRLWMLGKIDGSTQGRRSGPGGSVASAAAPFDS